MVRVRELNENEAKRLQRIVRRGAKTIVPGVVRPSYWRLPMGRRSWSSPSSCRPPRSACSNFNEAGMNSRLCSRGGPNDVRRPSRPRSGRASAGSPGRVRPSSGCRLHLELDKLRDYLVEPSSRRRSPRSAWPDPRRGGHHLSEGQVVEGVPRPRQGGQTSAHREGHRGLSRASRRL